MTPQQPLVLEQRDERVIAVRDAKDGSTLSFGTVETVMVDGLTGTKLFNSTTTVVRTLDGRLVRNPAVEEVHACSGCGAAPLSASAVVSCVVCACITCRECSKPEEHGAYCKSCHKKHQRKEFWRWLLQLQ